MKRSRKIQTLVANLSPGKVRRETLGGRKYLVAPLTLIVPGVLNGSNGPLFYPPEEVAKNPQAWNNVPIVVYHPKSDKGHVSAKDPEVLDKQGIGMVLKANVSKVGSSPGKLRAEGWFDEERTKAVDPRVYSALVKGQKMEVSTGLYTDNDPAENGANHNGRPYSYVARNYRPDHLAILPDQQGACSVKDGCGMNVNSFCATGEGGGIDPSCGKGEGGEGGGSKSNALRMSQKIASRVATDLVKSGFTTEHQDFRLAYADLDDSEKLLLIKDLAKRGAVDKFIARKRNPPTGSEVIDSVRSTITRMKEEHERIPINRHIPFSESVGFKRLISNRSGQQSADNLNSKRRRPSMAKKLKPERRQEIIANLLACNDCGWNEEDKEILESFTDEKLADLAKAQEKIGGMVKTVKEQESVTNSLRQVLGVGAEKLTLNAMPEFIKEKIAAKSECAPDDEKCLADEKAKAGAAKNQETKNEEKRPMTLDDWKKTAPAEVLEDLKFAANERSKQKKALVDRLTANIEDGDAKQKLVARLGEKNLDELQDLMALAGPPKEEAKPSGANYAGAAGAVTNALKDEERGEGLGVPTLNFEDNRRKKTA